MAGHCPGGHGKLGDMNTSDGGDRPQRPPSKVRLSPDYNAPSPLWPSSDATHALVTESLLARLVAWQEEFDANFRWDSGWQSNKAKFRWAAEAAVLEADLRKALAGKAELTVDLWPLEAS